MYDIEDLPWVQQQLVQNSFSVVEHHNVTGSPIVDAIVFSRKFVPTYYIFLSLVVFTFAVAHSRNRYDRVKHSKATLNSGDVHSSSSTLCEDETTPDKAFEDEERTTLLFKNKHTSYDAGFYTRLSRNFRSFLLYQPRPIPSLTAPINRLPSNGTSLTILLLLMINLFILFYRNIPTSLAWVQPFADRAGLCFGANLPILYILGIKNNVPLKKLTGWPYEELNIVHRRIGEWMVALACLHAAGMIMLWYEVFRPLGHSFAWFISIKIVALGLSTFLSILTIWSTSSGRFRKLSYEVFLACHIILQLAVLLLLFFHHRNLRPYCAAALAIWVVDRLVLRYFITRQRFVATLQIAPDKETVLVFCDVTLTHSRSQGICSGWTAGQHVFVSIPGLQTWGLMQAHPFTIASPAPPTGTNTGSWPLQLTIRSNQGFSREILDFARFHQHAEIIIDGPYGSSEVLDAVQAAERTCFIAGGSGITVSYPLAWTLLGSMDRSSIVSARVVYEDGAKHVPLVELVDSHLNQEQHAHFWIRQRHEHRSWLTMFPQHQDVSNSEPNRTRDLGVNLVTRDFDTRNTDSGRPDIVTELRDWFHTVSPTYNTKSRRVCVVVSGPDELARSVRNCVSTLVKDGYDVELFVEKFGW